MINKKQKVNAATSYFFMAIFFLLPSKNSNIKNKFVISHAKSALFLQIMLIVSYIIFIHLGYFKEFRILWQNLNDILMIISSVIILFMMWAWMFRANTWEYFSVFKNINFKNGEAILWKQTKVYTEKDKLFTILTYIPFLWILINKNWNDEPNFSISKFSSLIWIIFAILFMWWANNAINLSILFYLIFVIFIGLFLFIKEELLFFNLNIPTIKDIYLNFITSLVYIRNLIFSKQFIEYKNLKIKLAEFLDNKGVEDKKLLEQKNKCEINNKLFYIPIFNIFWLVFLKTNAKNHIISWLIITIILVLLYIFNLTNYSLFMVFFICYWIANNEKLEYKIPFVFDIYALLASILISIKNLWKKAKEKSVTKESSMKVWENK